MLKKKYLGLMIGLSLLLCSSTAVLANGPAVSLDDIGTTTENQVVESNTGTQEVQEETEVTVTEEEETTSTVEDAKNFMGSLQAATDMSAENETAKKIGVKMNRIVAVIVQVISYVITFGLTLRIAIDLTYIAVPFLRGVLGNGYSGSAQANQQNASGVGSFGNSFGGNRFGSMGSAFGGPAMGAGTGVSTQQTQQGGGIQFVSNAALNAVANEGVQGQDGKVSSVYKAYTKDMVLVLVITPVLLILAITGALTNLGLLLGEALSNFINGFSGFSL